MFKWKQNKQISIITAWNRRFNPYERTTVVAHQLLSAYTVQLTLVGRGRGGRRSEINSFEGHGWKKDRWSIGYRGRPWRARNSFRVREHRCRENDRGTGNHAHPTLSADAGDDAHATVAHNATSERWRSVRRPNRTLSPPPCVTDLVLFAARAHTRARTRTGRIAVSDLSPISDLGACLEHKGAHRRLLINVRYLRQLIRYSRNGSCLPFRAVLTEIFHTRKRCVLWLYFFSFFFFFYLFFFNRERTRETRATII